MFNIQNFASNTKYWYSKVGERIPLFDVLFVIFGYLGTLIFGASKVSHRPDSVAVGVSDLQSDGFRVRVPVRSHNFLNFRQFSMFWEGERRCRSRSWRDFHHLRTCEQAASSKNGLNAIRVIGRGGIFKHFRVFEKYSKLFVENFNYSIFDIRRSTVHFSKFIIRKKFPNRSPTPTIPPTDPFWALWE